MNKQAFAYPATVSHDGDIVIAEFLDVPEAHTQRNSASRDRAFRAALCFSLSTTSAGTLLTRT